MSGFSKEDVIAIIRDAMQKSRARKLFAPPCVLGEEDLMRPKAHGTSATPVQENLRWGCDFGTADRICNYNRHDAEAHGSWEKRAVLKEFRKEAARAAPVRFHDSNTGQILFTAPTNRSMEEFVAESRAHGWPSFRDDEVNWDLVRVLPDGETVSTAGTHCGHNVPDDKGNRYCINLCSVAGFFGGCPPDLPAAHGS